MSLQEREANGILAMGRVLATYQTAVRQYGPFHSCHEGLAVVQEEFEELKAEVFKKPAKRYRERLYAEAMQLGAMALRFMVELAQEEAVEAEKSKTRSH